MQRAGNMNWILSQIKPKCVSFMAYDLYYLALHLDLLYVYPGSIALDLLGGIGCIGFIVQHCIGFIGFNALNKLQIWPWHWFSSWHTVAQFSIQVDIGYLEILCRLLTSKARSDQCCIPCWHACKHAKPIGYIDMRSCQLSCRCSTLGTDHACNAFIAMWNCGSELCIVIKHAHINAFCCHTFPLKCFGPSLCFDRILHSHSGVTIAIECSLFQFFSVTWLLRSLMLHASLAPATTQWTISMCTTGKSILQRTLQTYVLVSTICSDEFKHDSNTIPIMQTTCMRHATVMCDMRCDCICWSTYMPCEWDMRQRATLSTQSWTHMSLVWYGDSCRTLDKWWSGCMQYTS